MTAGNQGCDRMKAALVGLLSVATLLLILASSASALTLGVGWSGDLGGIGPEMPLVAKSGAQAFRVPLPPTNDNGGIVRAASESGVTIHAEVSVEYPNDPGLPSGANRSDFLNKLSAEVRRFGYNGSFWSEPGNTSLPKKYITTWEIWNEPNLHGIGAEEFGQFVSDAAYVIQEASQAQAGRSTDVLSGGLLVWGNVGTGLVGYWGAAGYLHTAYAKFASNPNVTGVAIHPYEIDDATFYNGNSTTRLQAFEYAVTGFHNELVSLAQESGKPQKSLWITETGWPAEGPDHPIGEPEQANALRGVVNYLRANEGSLNVKDVLWYNFRDAPGNSSWDNFCGLRAHDGHFRQAWTAFQEKAGVTQVIPQEPAVQTGAASGVSASQATLNGTVNPGNIPTTYRFEYGTTTSYGSSVPVPDGNAGEGGSSTAVSASVQGLRPGTTYYFRIAATNALRTTSGSASSFTTPLRSKPAVLEQSNGDREIYFRSNAGQLQWWYWNAAKGNWSLQWLGSTGALAGDPAVLEESNGDRQIYYRSTGGQLQWWYWNAAKGNWSLQWLGTTGAMAGDPVPVNDGSGDGEVYYRSTSGQLQWWYWNAAKGNWSLQWLGSTGAMAGDPVVGEQPNGDRQIYYRSNAGQLQWWYWNAAKGNWSLQWLGSTGAMAGDPALGKQANGDGEVYYRSTAGQLQWWYWNAAKGNWSLQWLGSTGALAGDPAVGEQTNGDGEIYYRSTAGQLQWWYWNAAKGNWSLQWLGSTDAMGGDPVPVNDRSGDGEIYYGSPEGVLNWWWWHAGAWSQQWLTGAEL
jgi:hypothetical protein